MIVLGFFIGLFIGIMLGFVVGIIASYSPAEREKRRVVKRALEIANKQ